MLGKMAQAQLDARGPKHLMTSEPTYTALRLPPRAVGVLNITGQNSPRGIFTPADRSDLLETRRVLWSICACDERGLAAELQGLQSFQASFQRATLHGWPAIAR